MADSNRTWALIGMAAVGLLFGIGPFGSHQCTNTDYESNDDEEEYSDYYGSNVSFGSAQTGYTGECTFPGCSCEGEYTRQATGKCSICKHSRSKWHKWHN